MAMRWSPDDWARVGRQLRTWREAEGLSRRELSDVAGVSEKSIQLAEEGRVPKGRWPQSLTAMERALGWPAGRIEAMLDASDKPDLYDDPVVMRDGEPVIIDAETMMPYSMSETNRAADQEEDALAPPTYPPEIEEALPMVMFFASNCVAHGAPEWLGAAFENAVAALLKSLTEPPPRQESGPSGERVTREHSGYSTEQRGYSSERPGYRQARPALYRDPLARSLSGSKGMYEAVAKMSRQSAEYQATLRKMTDHPALKKLVEQSIGSQAIQQVVRRNAEYQKLLESLSAPARHAAALDLYARLKPIVEEADETPEGPTS